MAKRFEFRLQTLLDVRALREREAKRKVAVQRAKLAQLDQLDAQAYAEIEQQQAVLRAAQTTSALHPPDLQRGRAWVAYLRRSIAERAQTRATLRRELQDLLVALREARRQTRTLEKLREKQQAAYRRQRDRREQAESDELALQLQVFYPEL